MKAIICKKYGPAENLKIVEREKPLPKDDEVLIRVHASAVTDSDIFIRSSNVPKTMLIPFRLMIGILKPRNEILGEVFAGVIEHTGSKIKRFKVGDHVYGLTGMSLGAYADYMCMKEMDSKKGCVAIKPANISFEEATAAAYGGLLALQAMDMGNIKHGQKILVYGASGTTGTTAIQYANYLGAEVSGVCSTANIEFVKSLGAQKVFDYTKEHSLDSKTKYDFILDAVGKRKRSNLKEACKSALSKNGKYVSIDDKALLLSSKRLNFLRTLIEARLIKPIIDRCYMFDQIIDAHKFVEQGHKRGGVAITIANSSY